MVFMENEQMIKVLLANPRGFCAGVDRAIEIVERGAEYAWRADLRAPRSGAQPFRGRESGKKGAVFVENLDEVPVGSILIFSAHGVSHEVRREAEAQQFKVFDATCPLVTKVHIEVAKMREQGREIIMIGHAGHPEVEGTMGQAEGDGPCMYLVETEEDVENLQVQGPESPGLRYPDHIVGG